MVFELLKFGWIQFLATLVFFGYFFEWLRWAAYRFHVLDAHAVSDLQTRTQVF
jgi:hypothetical protein